MSSAPPPPPPLATGFSVRHDRYGVPGHDVWIAGSGAVVVGETRRGGCGRNAAPGKCDSPLGRGVDRANAAARGGPRHAPRDQLHQGLLRGPGNDRATEKRGPRQPHAGPAAFGHGRFSRRGNETHRGRQGSGRRDQRRIFTPAGRGIALAMSRPPGPSEGTRLRAAELELQVAPFPADIERPSPRRAQVLKRKDRSRRSTPRPVLS